MHITVVGQGYVGLPLAIKVADSGFTVFGLDDNEQKINKLKSGKSFIEDLSDQVIQTSVDSLRYIPTIDQEVIAKSQVVLICVPTPLSADHKPDLSALISATITVGKNLKVGSLVIIESTIEPGTCRNILLPILLKESGLKFGEFEVAYSPERIDPTNKKWGISNTPKLVAGLTDNAAKRAGEFYKKFIEAITICASLEIAETAKLLENSFRLVNI
jgi:nucleotide sugar dehydrogenase